MAKNDNDLFDRLRQVGLRKQVAKTLSGIGEGAGKKARTAAQSAISELRSVADEIERRMPGVTESAGAANPRSTKRSAAVRTSRVSSRSSATAAAARTTRSSAAKSRSSRSRTTAASPATRTRRTATARPVARATRTKTAAASVAKATPARAPRGQNKAKILASLGSGPKTASVIAKETGIGTGTVGSTLSKLAISGEVVKAERGYGLPS